MLSHRETEAAFRAGLASQDVPPGVTAVGDLAHRFSVYRNTVAHSLSEALAQRFPTVLRLVGPAFFKATARIFVADHPPRSAILHEYGTEFPDFLAAFPPAATVPYLADIARLEVLRGQAYHAADALPISVAEVTAAFASGPETIRLDLHPSVRVIVSRHPIVSIWAMNQPGATLAPLPPMPEAALIFRRGDNAVVLRISQDTAGVIGRLREGAPLGLACSTVEPDLAADAVGTILNHGLIVALNPT